MKKRISLLLMAFVAVTMLFTGCKKDNADLILGKWTVDGAKSYVTMTVMGATHTEYMDDGDNTLTFNSDGTVVVVSTDEDGETDTENGTYTLSADVLSMTLEGETVEFNIAELTESKMVLTTSQVIEEEGMTITTDIHMELTR